jgi:hypothetical protein
MKVVFIVDIGLMGDTGQDVFYEIVDVVFDNLDLSHLYTI